MAQVRKGDRAKTGFSDGSYPVSTAAQCLSAIRLRHHSKSHSASEVLGHVARAAARLRRAGKISEEQHQRIKDRIAAARKADAGRQ